MHRLFLFFLIPIFFAGCQSDNATPPKDETVFCTQDAKQCPDGSYVSRVPPTCGFAPCPIPNSPQAMLNSETISLTTLKKLPLDCVARETVLQTRCPAAGDVVVKMTTTLGAIWLRLFPQETPKTFENFTGLIERGYYDGLIFHRVIPNFMIQGGDPTGTGMGGTSIWGTEFADEFLPQLKNIRGALAMANRGPNTNGSQFFIVQAEAGTPWLDSRHTVFGQVFSGLSVVDQIAAAPRDGSDKPLQEVQVTKAELFTVQ